MIPKTTRQNAKRIDTFSFLATLVIVAVLGVLVRFMVLVGSADRPSITFAYAQEHGAEEEHTEAPHDEHPAKATDTHGQADAKEHDSSPALSTGPLPMRYDQNVSRYGPAELKALQALADRRRQLDSREARLSEREALLQATEQEIDRKVAELSKMKADMEKLLGQQKEEEEKQILSLVKIYENMKPKEAARIFDALDMTILLEVISRMNERRVSPILANMNPTKAKDLTVRLAVQRQLPGETSLQR